MKIAINIGHNCSHDGGAVGIQSEDKLCMDVGTKVIYKLRKLGHEVITTQPATATSTKHSLKQRCDKANASGARLFVSIHFNKHKGAANGTEVFCKLSSKKGKGTAQNILDEIVKLGFFNRGVKDGMHLYEMRNTDMTSVLVECCFIDNQGDMDLYHSNDMATAIVRGIVNSIDLIQS